MVRSDALELRKLCLCCLTLFARSPPAKTRQTMLAKALAAEARATFFNISASSLTSKCVCVCVEPWAGRVGSSHSALARSK